MKLVWDRKTTATNARNSEGSFIRQPDGGILFAYSAYSGNDWNDNAHCNIAGIRSFDEGETWSEPEILVSSEFYGVRNIMSVSAVYGKSGELCLYFLIKENAGNITVGRALSQDGYSFRPERCVMEAPLSYYVINNDRFVRLQDGRLAAPAAMHAYYSSEKADSFSIAVVLVSEDDGATFRITPARLTVSALNKRGRGMQEPGLYQYRDGTIYLWARTSAGYQYESFSRDFGNTFVNPQPSQFTSPCSPMELAEHEGVLYAVYNPCPSYDGHAREPGTMNRTPLVLRRSTDDGRSWSDPIAIESDKKHGYCYPAMFFTADGAMLCAYCRGGAPEEEICLQRLGIMKIDLKETIGEAEEAKA